MSATGERKSPGSIAEWGQDLMAGTISMDATVPCGACNACCRNPALVADLAPDEMKDFADAVEVDGQWQLPKKPGGECVHLEDGRCGIYDRRPVSCRSYDCRRHLLGQPPGSPKQIGFVRDVFSMWGDWEMETPEDVDHMFAWHRAMAEGYLNAFDGTPATPVDLMIDVMSRFRRYAGPAREMRDSYGFDTARSVVLDQDRRIRGDMLVNYGNMRWTGARETPIVLGPAMNAIAERIGAQIGKIVPGGWAFAA